MTRVSSGTRARSRAARTSASIAASLPISFFLPISLLGLVVVDAVVGVVVTVAATEAAAVVSATTSVFVVSALSPSAASVSFNFLLRASSPLDSDTVRLLAAAAAAVAAPSSVFDASDATWIKANLKIQIK